MGVDRACLEHNWYIVNGFKVTMKTLVLGAMSDVLNSQTVAIFLLPMTILSKVVFFGTSFPMKSSFISGKKKKVER